MRGFVTLAEYQTLQERCDRLEAELDHLRDEASEHHRAHDVATLRARFSVLPCVAHLLAILNTHRTFVSTAKLNARIPWFTGSLDDPDPVRIKVMVKYARYALGSEAIETLYGYGYRLTPSGIALVEAALSAED